MISAFHGTFHPLIQMLDSAPLLKQGTLSMKWTGCPMTYARFEFCETNKAEPKSRAKVAGNPVSRISKVIGEFTRPWVHSYVWPCTYWVLLNLAALPAWLRWDPLQSKHFGCSVSGVWFQELWHISSLQFWCVGNGWVWVYLLWATDVGSQCDWAI